MNCCTVLIKIKDFFPKIKKIPFDNYICIFTNNEFEGRISLMQYEYQYIKHELLNINSDIKYKIKVIDFNKKRLIGICNYNILYDKINNINIGSSIDFINQIKLIMSQKSKKDIFGSLNNSNDIYFTISTEIIKFNKSIINYTNVKDLTLKTDRNKKKINKVNKNIFNNKNNKDNNDNININKNINNNKFNKDINSNNIYDKKKINKNNIEYIKTRKINKKEEFNFNNENNISSNRNTKRYENSKNELKIISPVLFTEADKNKNNINLNMHNICVQNYYNITSSSPHININTMIKKENNNNSENNHIQEKINNNIYTKKKLNLKIKYDIIKKNTNLNGSKEKEKEKEKIKRYITNTNINNKRERYYLNYGFNKKNFISKKSNSNEHTNKNLSENKIKIKEKKKEKLLEYYLTKYRLNDNIKKIKNNKLYNSKNNYTQTKNDKYIKKKNNIKNYYSVDDKFKQNKLSNNNKNIKINKLFKSTIIGLPKKSNSIIIKRKPLISNITKYLNSTENLSTMTLNSSSILNINNYNKKYHFDKYDYIISPKCYTIRDTSNKNLKIRLNNNSDDKLLDKLIEECNNNSNDNFKKQNNNYLIQKNKIILENEYKEKILNLLEFNFLLSKKLTKLKKVYKNQKMKDFLYKEKYLHMKHNKNIIKQKKENNKMSSYIHVNINCRINNEIIPKIKKIKKREMNIYENIFNININKDDILNQLQLEQIQKDNENKKINILLKIIKNIIHMHGNIIQIYNNNIYKKRYLFYLLINNGIEINNVNFYLPEKEVNNNINNKYKCKEIKEEIDEEEEDNDDEDKEKEISIKYKNENENIIDKILIEDFPIKYNKITNKKFEKKNSNEYLFDGIKVLAFYKNEDVFLKVENDNDNNKEYSFNDFISKYIINKNKKEREFLSPIHIKRDIFYSFQKGKNYNSYIDIIDRSKKKKYKRNNIDREKYSRNHKIINEIEYNQEDFRKIFLNGKIVLSNDDVKSGSNLSNNDIKENIYENNSLIEKFKFKNENGLKQNLSYNNNIKLEEKNNIKDEKNNNNNKEIKNE